MAALYGRSERLPESQTLFYRPKQPVRKEDTTLRGIFADRVQPSLARQFLDQISLLPGGIINYIKDEEWMAFLSELFGIASHICSMTATEASKFVPYLSIVSTPVYLFHAGMQAKQHFYYMYLAAKVARFSDFFFWGSKALGSLGGTLSDVIKPFAGGLALLGITQIHALTFCFSYIFPIVLIALSGVGGSSQVWGFLRSAYSLHKFRQKQESIDGSLQSLRIILRDLKGPVRERLGEKREIHHKLNAKHFSQTHFTSQTREKELTQRVAAIFDFRVESYLDDVDNINDFLSRAANLALRPIDTGQSLLVQVDEGILLCDKMIEFAKNKKEYRKSFFKKENLHSVIENLTECKKRLMNIKEKFYAEGLDIITSVHNEMVIKLRAEFFGLFASAVNLAAGVLFLAFPQLKLVGYILSLGGSSLSSFNVILSKISRYSNYPQTEKFLELLKEDEEYRRAKKLVS